MAVEVSAEPLRLAEAPAAHCVFRRLPLAEIAQAAGAKGAHPGFRALVSTRMGYWEERVPAGQSCFVHYAIGDGDAMDRLFVRLAAQPERFLVIGVYHVEPQSSAYPASFPVSPAPSHARLGVSRPFTEESIFWFNFFPAQSYLFEKTFAAWASFQSQKLAESGECNQLVSAAGERRLWTRGADEMVQVNLNRFTSLPGFFASAHDAGESTFSGDAEYVWYGMLLRKV